MDDLHIIFDGLPDRIGPRFIEVEDASGRSLSCGEWGARPDGLAELVIPTHRSLLERALSRLDEVYDPQDDALHELRHEIRAAIATHPLTA
jgi:hypothetical protein